MLTEVLIAFVILMISLSSLFTTVGLGIRVAGGSEQERQVTVEMASLMSELGRSRPLIQGSSEGDFAAGQHWRLDIEPASPTENTANQPIAGYHVVATASWQQDGKVRSLQFQTMRLAAGS